GWSANELTDDAATAAQLAQDELAHDVVTLRARDEAQRAAAKYWPRCGEVDVPVLVLAGEADPHVDVSRVRALASGSVEVATLAGQRHDPFQGTRREEAAERLLAFLDITRS